MVGRFGPAVYTDGVQGTELMEATANDAASSSVHTRTKTS